MAKFKCELSRIVRMNQIAYVTVEADDENEAKQIACQMGDRDEVDWEDDNTEEEYECGCDSLEIEDSEEGQLEKG